MDWLSPAKTARREIFARFLEPETRQVVTYAENWKKGLLPTPDEAARAIPNGPSYSTGIEDGALRGSAFLAALCDEYDLTRDDEVKAQAHAIFEGLRRAQFAAEPPGFVPRWMLADGRSCYPNSSGDQHTILLYGLWRYAKSPLAADAHRRDAALIASRVVGRIRDHGWRIVARDGADAAARPGGRTGGGRLTDARLLGVLLAAHRITGDPQWLACYEKEAAQDLRAMVSRILGDGPTTPSGWGFYGPEQQSELMTVLVEEAPDPQTRAIFREARAEIARRFLRTPIPTPAHCPAYTEACREALGQAAHIPDPLTAHRFFRPALWGIDEDRDWRGGFREWSGMGRKPDPTAYVLWWMGRRPALCHERSAVISPLVAYHVGLLADSAELADRIRAPLREFLQTVDVAKARKLGSLTAAHAAAVLAMKSGLA